jgi:Ca2+-binding EF-hand superfamily protein
MRRFHLVNLVIPRSTALGVALGLAFATAAHAQNLGSFSAADVNHVGCITLQEFSAYETKRLMAGHGFIAGRFQQMAPQEQQARLAARFKQLDKSHNGCLDQSEWNGA